MVSFMQLEYNDNLPSGKGASVTKEVFQPTKETPIKPSLLILTNAKDNRVVSVISFLCRPSQYCLEQRWLADIFSSFQ